MYLLLHDSATESKVRLLLAYEKAVADKRIMVFSIPSRTTSNLRPRSA